MDRKTKRKVWVPAGFLILMAVFTILSRAAASVLVAQVSVEKPGRGRLSFSYSGNGTVVPGRENVIFLWPDQQVEWAADAGSTVKAGECLIQFRMEYLQKAIQSQQAELTRLELQAQQQQISARGTARVPAAERALQTLTEAQEKLQEALQKEAQVQEALQKETQAQEALQKEAQAQDAYNQSADSGSAGNDAGLPETYFDQNAEENSAVFPQAISNESTAQQELESALQQAQADVEAARQAVAQAQTDYDFSLKEDAAQNTNEANAIQSAQLGVQSLNVQADQARQALEQLLSYQNAGGKICAEQDCTVLMSGVQAGTFTTGGEVLVTGSGGWKLKGLIDAKDKEKLKAGDEAEIRLGAGKKRTVRIESVTAEQSAGTEEGGSPSSLQFCWYTRLPENTTAENGNTFTWTVNTASDQEYEQVIPLSALREDSSGAYCLILSEENTMLGTVQTAKQVPVTVLEKDGQKAAVTSALKETDQIIASSEKYVEKGDRVRVEE